MGKRADTWMPLYVGDYLRDTGRLTTEGHGAYLLLIFDYWTSGKPLPDNDQQLAAIARLPLPRWKALRSVLAAFFQVGDGIWRHKRIDDELANSRNLTDERSKAGAKGAAKRWQRDGNGNDKTIAKPLANRSQNDAPLPKGPKGPRKEPTHQPSESATAREVFENDSGLGRYAPLDPALATEGEKVEVANLVERAVASLNGSATKGIHNAEAHAAAIKRDKFHRLILACNDWVGEHLDGAARHDAWETLAAAEEAKNRAGMTAAQRKKFDAVVALWRSAPVGGTP